MAGNRDPIAEQEVRRWKEREGKDLEVERKRGERPLEGFSADEAGSTWAVNADDSGLSAKEHGADKDRSDRESERQASKKA